MRLIKMSINKELSIQDQYEVIPKKEKFIVIEECLSSMKYGTNFLIAAKIKIENKECWIPKDIYNLIFQKK
jgi:hypothetical protein